MKRNLLIPALATAFMLLPVCASAQYEEDPIPLGDLARTLRRGTTPPVANVIDNDNMAQVMDAVESRRPKGGLTFSFDGLGKSFQISSPDVTCSLSFNAQMTSLISDPMVSRELPESQLAKLDGPASIEDGVLQITIFNRSGWDVKEITVGLTIVRRQDSPPQPTTAYYGQAKLLPAAATVAVSAEKRSDTTVLYHLKGSSMPQMTAIFRESLVIPPDPDQEWHWAIVQARGIPAEQVQQAQ